MIDPPKDTLIRLPLAPEEATMGRLFRLALCLLVGCCLCAFSGVGESPQAPKSLPLACTIRSEPTCELGKAPKIRVEITNLTESDIYLVGSLDGSDSKWRYPFCYFDVIGPDGKSAARGIARCGNINAIRDKDFVKVPRSGTFDPYQKIDDYGFFSSSQISPATFGVEGKYRIRFVYSTEKAEPKYWLGDAQGETVEILATASSKDKVLELLPKVPKTTVASDEITVMVVQPHR
jgi:hypothetical protein